MEESNVSQLIEEGLQAIAYDTRSLLTQIKIHDILELLSTLENYDNCINSAILFILSLKSTTLPTDVQELYNVVVAKLITILPTTALITKPPVEVPEVVYDYNLANAIQPLSEIAMHIHKTGELLHFIEHKYKDAAGRYFATIETPPYDIATDILQYNVTQHIEQ